MTEPRAAGTHIYGVAHEGDRPRIVVGVDGSTGARAALAQALLEAGRRDADLHVVAAYTLEELFWAEGAPIDVLDAEAVRDDADRLARELVEQVRRDATVTAGRGTADVAVQVEAANGPAASVLVERAHGAELLVVGSRGRGGLRSAFLGSVALHCVTHAPCAVEVVHTGAHPDPDAPRVVVGVDGSVASRTALAAAVEEAVRRGASLDVVVSYVTTNYWTDLASVVIPPEEEIRGDLRQRTEALMDDVLGQRGTDEITPDVRVVVDEGPPGDVLIRHGRTADLLVLGSRGHGAFRGLLLGSVALNCAMHAVCPVLVVHPPKERRPHTMEQPAFAHVQH